MLFNTIDTSETTHYMLLSGITKIHWHTNTGNWLMGSRGVGDWEGSERPLIIRCDMEVL